MRGMMDELGIAEKRTAWTQRLWELTKQKKGFDQHIIYKDFWTIPIPYLVEKKKKKIFGKCV